MRREGLDALIRLHLHPVLPFAPVGRQTNRATERVPGTLEKNRASGVVPVAKVGVQRLRIARGMTRDDPVGRDPLDVGRAGWQGEDDLPVGPLGVAVGVVGVVTVVGHATAPHAISAAHFGARDASGVAGARGARVAVSAVSAAGARRPRRAAGTSRTRASARARPRAAARTAGTRGRAAGAAVGAAGTRRAAGAAARASARAVRNGVAGTPAAVALAHVRALLAVRCGARLDRTLGAAAVRAAGARRAARVAGRDRGPFADAGGGGRGQNDRGQPVLEVRDHEELLTCER
jgi:hypothetical protein